MAEPTQTPEVVFNIEKVYIKDFSFESPGVPAVFFEQNPGQPQVDIRLDVEHNAVTEGVYEVVLAVTATTKVQDKTLFLVEAHQAGLFQVRGVAPDLLVYFDNLGWRSVGSFGHGDVYTFENDTGPDDANHAENANGHREPRTISGPGLEPRP